jgi:hypothetical protein
MHTAIASKQSELANICQRFDVARLEVFGSAARAADFDASLSDADFLVEFQSESSLDPLHQYFGLAAELEALLGRPVDLLQPKAIINPYLRSSINRSRELIYAA